jgi:hypothetical protein
MPTFVKILFCLLVLGAVACETSTAPDYRPNNPPPAPRHVPRALEHGGHMGMGMSNEVSEEEAEKLREGAAPESEQKPVEEKPAEAQE